MLDNGEGFKNKDDYAFSIKILENWQGGYKVKTSFGWMNGKVTWDSAVKTGGKDTYQTAEEAVKAMISFIERNKDKKPLLKDFKSKIKK